MIRSAGRTCLLAALVLLPGAALAQCPSGPKPAVIGYEVAEVMSISTSMKGGGAPRRDATATIVGWAAQGSPICPTSLGLDPCTVTVVATDLIRLDTGQGPVKGTFYVLGPGDNDSDGDEGILIEGWIRGTIDLSPALHANTPIAHLTGGSLQGRGVKGTPVEHQTFKADFEGTFRLPFPGPGGPSYLCPGPVIQPVEQDEQSLGVPTVRLEITFQ
jgi:hypothetical protein